MRILHMFNFPLHTIIDYLPKVKEQGFNAIQISPIQPNKFDRNLPWWGLYQPISFTIGNQLGTEDDLIHVCKIAKELNITIIVDVVINHMASKDDGSIEPHERVNSELRNNKYFWKCNKRISNWKDRQDVITNSLGCPGLRLDNYELQNIVIKFLNRLISDGVRGFRFDAAKNISLPEEDGNHFWTRVLGSLDNRDELFNYAEIIFEERGLLDKYSKYVNIITTSEVSDINKQISYVENHDTFLEFKSDSHMNSNEIIYKYSQLSNKYRHTLFYIRPFDNTWQNEQIKRANG